MVKIKIMLRVASSRQMFLLPSVVICLCAIGVDAWQIGKPQVAEKTELQKRIAVLIREALQEGEGTVDGTRIWTRVPPSPKAIEEIKKYGDDSVPVLTRYLDSDNERERALAVDFLGRLGGRHIIVPLRNVIRYDASRTIRIQALHWISHAPWELASPVIREARETDLDPEVRETAKDILVDHPPE